MACSYAISTELPALVEPLGLSDGAVGWLGFTITAIGLTGSVLSGAALDRALQLQLQHQHDPGSGSRGGGSVHRRALLGLVEGAALSVAAFGAAVATAESGLRPWGLRSRAPSLRASAALTFAAAGSFGFFITGALSVGACAALAAAAKRRVRRGDWARGEEW